MIHTFELSQTITREECDYIDSVLFRASKTKPHHKKKKLIDYSMKITTYKRLPDCEAEMKIVKFRNEYRTVTRFCLVINPAKIVYGDLLSVSDRKTSELAILQVNRLLDKLKINYSCSGFDLRRIDYALNNRFGSADEAEKQLKLIKRGDIPCGFKVYEEFSPSGHRFISPKSSLYCCNGSVTLNFYNKYIQMKELQNKEGYSAIDEDVAKGVLRFEIQCHAPKVNTIKSVYNLPNKSVYSYLDNEISKQTLIYYLEKVCCRGDYYTYDETRSIIESSKIKPDNIILMLRLLELTNKKRNGLHKTKSILQNEGVSLEQINNTVTRFNDLNVNPVTIPQKWHIEKMNNPIKLLFG